MFWLSSLVALCTGLAATHARYSPTIQVIRNAPSSLDIVKVCSTTTMVVDVQFKTVKVGDTEYTRTVLSSNDFRCIEAGAEELDSTDFLACAKEAFAKAYNIFYMFYDDECYGTNQPLASDAPKCTAEDKVVYAAVTAVGPFIKTAPNLDEFFVTDLELMKSFVVNFAPSCYGFEYELRSGNQTLKTVENNENVTSDSVPISPCPGITLSLQTLVDGVASGTATIHTVTDDSHFFEVDGTCYYFSNATHDFLSAKNSCPEGTVLASPSDDAHRNKLIEYLGSKYSTSKWYVDLTLQNGKWTFGDGVTTSAVKEISKGSPECARIDPANQFILGDVDCSQTNFYICQFN